MIYGYSERGIFNSIIYYLEFRKPGLIGEFLEKLGVLGFTKGKHTFTFLNEQSFSDFGDNDLTIIIDEDKPEEKVVVFVEGKVKTFSKSSEYSLKDAYDEIEHCIKNAGDNVTRIDTSNLFIQLYFKYLLSKGEDIVSVDNDNLKKIITKNERKIGENDVVIRAHNKYIKGAKKYHYVAIIPKQKDKSETLQEYFKKLDLMKNEDVKDNIHCAFWQDIEAFFVSEKAEPVINNFNYNKGQIYMKTTFNEELKQLYDTVCNKNKEQIEIKRYYCASSSGAITPRNLELTNDYVFCDIKHKDNKPKKNSIKEYKLEAFMIKKSLENKNWLLPIKGKEWKLLDAERTFTKEELSEKGRGQRLDILAYEEKTKSYIVLELKANENKRDLSKANKELECYTNTLKTHIKEANMVYSVEAENVKGYIVWNAPRRKPQNNETKWGLIEYNIDTLNNDVDNLEFSIIKEYLS